MEKKRLQYFNKKKNIGKTIRRQSSIKIWNTYLLFYILDHHSWFFWYHGLFRPPEKIIPALLEDKQRFPDSSFSASAFSEGHSASDARISSGSSWCAPVLDGKYYIEVDLRRLYRLFSVVTYGDSTSSKWVATYSVNYTDDLLNWKTTVRNNGITKTIINYN